MNHNEQDTTPEGLETPIAGAKFDLWLVDFITGKLHHVQKGLSFDHAVEWQREWMTKDQRCSPLIVRCGYEVPRMLIQSELDPTPKSSEKRSPVRKKRSKSAKPRQSVNLLS